MKVLIINSHISDGLGGSQMQCDLIARGLAERGHDVVYGAIVPEKESSTKSYPCLPYKTVPLLMKKKGEFAKLLKQEKPDIIYWRYNKNYLLRAVRENRAQKIPFVFAISHINDIKRFACKSLPEKSGLINRYKRLRKTIFRMLVSARNYRSFRHVDAATTNNSRYLNKLPVKKQCVIWNSVPDRKEPFEWGKRYCLWVANISADKRPEAYIKLSEIMAARCPEVDFLMIGAMRIQADDYEPIIRRAEEIPNFHYLGFQKPEVVNSALEKAECLVHTCKPEGFSNNFIQAWMQGCPTVTLEFDPDALMKKERLGFVSGTVEQMAEDVELLLRDRQIRDEIGERARVFARARFTTGRMIEEVETFLKEVMDEFS